MSARAARVDSNQAQIVRALRDVGIHVFVTSGVGDGFPDLVAVRRDGRVILLEVKTETGHLQPDQVRVMMSLVNPAYRIYTTVEDAVCGVIEA